MGIRFGPDVLLLRNEWPRESLISDPFTTTDANDTVNEILQQASGKKKLGRQELFLTEDRTHFIVRHNVLNKENCLRLVKAILGNGNERSVHRKVTEFELKDIIGPSEVYKILQLGRSRLSYVAIQ